MGTGDWEEINIHEIWYSRAKHLQGNGVIACILNVTLLLKVKWWQTSPITVRDGSSQKNTLPLPLHFSDSIAWILLFYREVNSRRWKEVNRGEEQERRENARAYKIVCTLNSVMFGRRNGLKRGGQARRRQETKECSGGSGRERGVRQGTE